VNINGKNIEQIGEINLEGRLKNIENIFSLSNNL
jgi:hypothetical protein